MYVTLSHDLFLIMNRHRYCSSTGLSCFPVTYPNYSVTQLSHTFVTVVTHCTCHTTHVTLQTKPSTITSMIVHLLNFTTAVHCWRGAHCPSYGARTTSRLVLCESIQQTRTTSSCSLFHHEFKTSLNQFYKRKRLGVRMRYGQQ